MPIAQIYHKMKEEIFKFSDTIFIALAKAVKHS
jgi:hypothetical protein